jgi:lysophospholipase L1-like esterase
VFNVFLELVAQTRRDYGYNVNVVDAFSVLSVDSVFNDTLMSEYLHPNQLGYDRLAKAIWQSILTH